MTEKRQIEKKIRTLERIESQSDNTIYNGTLNKFNNKFDSIKRPGSSSDSSDKSESELKYQNTPNWAEWHAKNWQFKTNETDSENQSVFKPPKSSRSKNIQNDNNLKIHVPYYNIR